MNEKQLDAFITVKNNENLFLTGSAGTGKSYTIKKIIEYFEKVDKNYGLTALTGCAASLINGNTLHSFLCLGIDKKLNEIYNDIIKFKPKYNKLKLLETLIIDEISMMNNELLELIDNLFKMIKNNDKTFGGIQIILIGDFHQLPPVVGNYCFTSPIWEKLNLRKVVLTELIRQKDDIELQEILEEMRIGKLSDKSFEKLSNLKNTVFSGEIKPTKLYPTNVNVDKINENAFKKLLKKNDNIYRTYKARSKYPDKNISNYDISLTLNAQIMVIRNINVEGHLVNGTRGIIIEMDDNSVKIKDVNNRIHTITYYTDINKNVKNTISFMPIKLAYAMSIHKSQGSSIDCLEIDLGDDIFVSEQEYTALSRGTNLKNIKINNIEKNSFFINKKILEFYK